MLVGVFAYRLTTFGQGSRPVHIGKRIVDCILQTENRCTHSRDVGLECFSENYYSQMLNLFEIFTVPCTPEGGVMLTGGDRPGRGTVWVCISGTWSTVCDKYT